MVNTNLANKNEIQNFKIEIEIEKKKKHKKCGTIGKGICRCMSTEHGDNELELGPDDILVDGLIKKGIKDQSQLEVAIGDGMEFTIHGDLKNKGKKGKLNSAKVNNIYIFNIHYLFVENYMLSFFNKMHFKQMIGNSIAHQDNRLEHELRGLSLQDDDTASLKSYGSHLNRPFKDESHKGSAETMEGEEKRDVSKEDLGLDEGEF